MDIMVTAARAGLETSTDGDEHFCDNWQAPSTENASSGTGPEVNVPLLQMQAVFPFSFSAEECTQPFIAEVKS